MLLMYTNRFFKPCPGKVSCFGAEHFIRVLMNRLSKTDSAVSNIVGSLYF